MLIVNYQTFFTISENSSREEKKRSIFRVLSSKNYRKRFYLFFFIKDRYRTVWYKFYP